MAFLSVLSSKCFTDEEHNCISRVRTKHHEVEKLPMKQEQWFFLQSALIQHETINRLSPFYKQQTEDCTEGQNAKCGLSYGQCASIPCCAFIRYIAC